MNEWPVELLGSHANIRARIGWRGLSSDEYTDDGPYLVAGKHLVDGKIDWQACDHLSRWRYEESPEIALRIHDVVISKDGTIGRVARVDELPGLATLNGTMMLVRPHDTLDHRFLAHSLGGQGFQKLIADRVSGSSIPHLFQRDLVQLQLQVPPLKEQRRIAEILDTIDEAIQATKRVITKCECVLEGLLQEASLGDHEAGSVSTAIRDFCKLSSGRTPPRASASYFGGGVPWVKSGEVAGQPIFSTHETVSVKALNDFGMCMVRSGTPLIAMYGATAGQVGWLAMAATTNQAVLAVDPADGRANRRWLYWALRHSAGRMLSAVQGTGQPNLSKGVIGATQMCLPSITKQMAEARRIDAAQTTIDAHRDLMRKLVCARKALAFDLLSGRVRTIAT